MMGKESKARARGIAGLISAACVGGMALATDAPSLPERLGGLLNDYTPASVSGGPYEMRGKWTMEVHARSNTADFSAAMNMETSDWGISKGTVDPNDPTTRGAHTHHITVTGATISHDVSGCPTFNPPTSGGFVIQGTVSVTGNGGVAPFEKPPNPPSSATICVLGGAQVAYSNITLTFTGPATGHFGTHGIHGVVSCFWTWDLIVGNCGAP